MNMTRRHFAKSTAILAASTLVTVRAFAHAVPKVMVPAPDSTVTAPTEISITFSEEIKPAPSSSIKLVDSMGMVVSKEDAKLDPKDAKHLTLALPKGLPKGVYTVQWTSWATDDHKLSRTYNFTIA